MQICIGRLSTQPDRVASAVIYDHAHGTIPALLTLNIVTNLAVTIISTMAITVDDSSSISFG